MISEVSISTAEILRACIAQSSVDFMALRTVNPQGADSLYDDYVLSEDQAPEFMHRLEVVAAELHARLVSYVVSYHMHGEHIGYRFRTENRIPDCRVLHILIREYLKCGMLSWWYAGRNAERQAYNTVSGPEIGAKIAAMLAPKSMTRRGRWF